MVHRHKHLSLHYICTRMQHHAEHSGYDQIIRYTGGHRMENNYIHKSLDHCPERILGHLRSTAGFWYNSEALKQELQLLPHFLLGSNQIFHFLYAEDGYHYSGYLNPRKSNKLVATYHTPQEKFFKITTGRHHLKKLDAVIILSPNQEQIFRGIVAPDRVHLIPHGVDTTFFTPGAPEQRHRLHCLFVGTHLRDFSCLHEVISRINYRNPSVSFTIVTAAEHLPLFSDLRNMRLLTGISEQHLLELYRTSTLLLLPMLDCTANNSVLEAMACGLPVITSDVGGIGYYLPPGTGLLLPSGNAGLMADAVLDLLNDHGRLAAMSREARTAAAAFAWSAVAQKLITVYTNLLKS